MLLLPDSRCLSPPAEQATALQLLFLDRTPQSETRGAERHPRTCVRTTTARDETAPVASPLVRRGTRSRLCEADDCRWHSLCIPPFQDLGQSFGARRQPCAVRLKAAFEEDEG